MRLAQSALMMILILAAAVIESRVAVGQADERLYRIEGVEVAETAENAVAARNQAMADGKRRGLIRLLERLTAPEDRSRLPSFEDVPIDRYVLSFDVVDEQVSSISYEAALNLTYASEPVQGLLRGLGIPFVIRASEPVLVIPATRRPEGLELWGEPDRWTEAWYEAAEGPGMMNLVLPLGDLEDVSSLTTQDLAAGRTEGAEALARRYGTEDVILSIAVEPPRPAQPPAPEPASPAEAETDADNDAGTDAETEPAEPMPDRLLVQAIRLDGSSSTIFNQTFRRDALAIDANIYEVAATAVVRSLADEWKSNNIVRLDVVQSLPVNVPLESLQDWVAVRRSLEDTPEIREVHINTLSRQMAALSLDYVGSEAKLRESLERRGQQLMPGEEGLVIRPLGWLPAAEIPVVPPAPATSVIEGTPVPQPEPPIAPERGTEIAPEAQPGISG